MRESNIPHAGLGVFATRHFAIGSTFGPYKGDKIKGNVPQSGLDTSYMWEVRCILVEFGYLFNFRRAYHMVHLPKILFIHSH